MGVGRIVYALLAPNKGILRKGVSIFTRKA